MDQTVEQLKARIAELELAAGKKNAATPDLHIGKKGGVSLKLAGAWPVTLTAERWDYVLSKADEIRAFIKANQALLVPTVEESKEEVKA
jgi:hypothetical protein